MVPNGVKWCWMVLMVQNGTKLRQNKWYQTKTQGNEWYRMLPNITEWYKMVLNGTKWYWMVQNGTKPCQMLQNANKWCQMVPNDTELCQIVLDGTKWWNCMLVVIMNGNVLKLATCYSLNTCSKIVPSRSCCTSRNFSKMSQSQLFL